VVPLTTKLKFRLAMLVSIDPITIASATSMAGIIDPALKSEIYAA
jgi:hypothetical protein